MPPPSRCTRSAAVSPPSRSEMLRAMRVACLFVVGLVLAAACGSKTPKLQSHDLPKSRQGTTVNEPKCPDNPPLPCRKIDEQCNLDEGRACYVCQCNMAG